MKKKWCQYLSGVNTAAPQGSFTEAPSHFLLPTGHVNFKGIKDAILDNFE